MLSSAAMKGVPQLAVWRFDDLDFCAVGARIFGFLRRQVASVPMCRQADTVLIGWGWGGNRDHVDLIEIQVDRGEGKGFVPLAYDTTPNYTDTTPFPTTLTRWKYRAISRAGEAQVGQWSATAEVAVGG